LRKCYEQAGTECLGIPVTASLSQKLITIASLPKQLQCTLKEKFRIPRKASCYSLSWISIEGWRAFKTGLVVLDKTAEGRILLLSLQYILQLDGLSLLCGTLVVCEKFLSHYHAYTIHRTDEWLAIVPQEGISSHPLVSSYPTVNGEVVMFQHLV
jgi:hypothetical protein